MTLCCKPDTPSYGLKQFGEAFRRAEWMPRGLIAAVWVPLRPGSSRKVAASVDKPARLMNPEAISKLHGADAQGFTQSLCLSHMIAIDYRMVVSEGTPDKVVHIAHFR